MNDIRNIRENVREAAERAGEQVSRTGQEEGRLAREIEKQTSKLPSDTFLWAAGASIIASLALHQFGRKDDAQFVGQWAPTLLIVGLYNKIVKELGHD